MNEKNGIEVQIDLHKSCAVEGNPIKIRVEDSLSIIDAIWRGLCENGLQNRFFGDKKTLRPGYLIICDKRELVSTGKITEKLTKDMQIRIVPTTHGG